MVKTRASPQWEDLVAAVTDITGYREVVRSMFDDGVVNPGRLMVLRVFTREVCARVTDGDTIWRYYQQTVLPRLGVSSDRRAPAVALLVGLTCAVLCGLAARYG